MTTPGRPSVASIVRSALAARTGWDVEGLANDVSLADVGLDSLDLIELLVTVSDHIADEYGVTADVAGGPEGLPWIETVGDLVDLVTSAALVAGCAHSTPGRSSDVTLR